MPTLSLSLKDPYRAAFLSMQDQQLEKGSNEENCLAGRETLLLQFGKGDASVLPTLHGTATRQLGFRLIRECQIRKLKDLRR